MNTQAMNLFRSLIYILLIVVTASISAQDDTHILKREIFKPPLSCIRFTPDGSRLMAGFSDGSFRLMDPETFETLLEVKDAHVKAVNALAMPPSMDFILSAGHNMIKIWDLEGNQLTYWAPHATTIWNAEISTNGRYAVSSEFNKTFRLWDVYNSKIIKQMRGHEDVTMAVTFSPDNHWIASGSSDLTIKLWDVESQEAEKTFYGPTLDIYDLAFSPDSRLLAAASKDRSIRIYDVEKEEMIHLLKGHRDFVMEVEFSPDGKYLISASADHSIILWDVPTGEKIYAFLDNSEPVLDLCYHPDGNSFYSISFAGDLTRWAVDHEIFVEKYFGKEYQEELDRDPLFSGRQKGESRKEYAARMNEATAKKSQIIDKYYSRYISTR